MATTLENCGKKRSPNWREDEVVFLINLWQKYSGDLIGQRRTSSTYKKITDEFCICYPDRTLQDIKTKIKNLMWDYRKEKLKEANGFPSRWKFYGALNETFQNLPVDDIAFMQESLSHNVDASNTSASDQKSRYHSESLLESPELNIDNPDQKKGADTEAENFHSFTHSLLTQYKEYAKKVKEIDAKFLNGVEHLNQLQASSYNINFKMHKHIQKFVQVVGKSLPLNSCQAESKAAQELPSQPAHNSNHYNTSNCSNVDSSRLLSDSTIATIVKVEPLNSDENEMVIHSKDLELPNVTISPDDVQSEMSSPDYDRLVVNDPPSKRPCMEKDLFGSDDDDICFLKSILPDLKSLPRSKKAYVRLKIQELIYNQAYIVEK